MKNIPERQKDILAIISSLDISPTMYENAIRKYKAITAFLNDCGIEADMYPQGSFAFGTVVRPNVKQEDAGYDLDFICQLKGTRSDFSPSELRKKIETALNSSQVYGGKLEVYKECFTIEYADINGVSFSIDIVPAAAEDEETKLRLIRKSSSPHLIHTAIAIPKHNGDRNYSWLTNNPKGFRAWFDQINEAFLTASREAYRNRLFEQNRNIYASVEKIPSALERSALQRVIQILKYHRDVYYSKLDDGDDIKPISAILNTIVTRIASQHSPQCSVFELLKYVLDELNIYAMQQNLTSKDFSQRYGDRSVLSRQEGKWYIANPANPEDNLADKWNSNSRIPRIFFLWIKAVYIDLIESLEKDDAAFRSSVENGFGQAAVNSALGKKYNTKPAPTPIITHTAPKPYRYL